MEIRSNPSLMSDKKSFHYKKASDFRAIPNNYLVFIKSSFGEVFVILPLLYFLKKQRPDINIFFVFNGKAVYKSVTQIEAYKSALQSLGHVVIGLRAFICCMLTRLYKSDPLYMLTCDNGIETLQRIALTYFVCPIPVFFHHAYALHVGADQDKIKELHKSYIIGSCVLANNRDDKLHYRAMCFEEKNIFFTGAQGYREEWLEKIVCQNPYKDFSGYRKIVFVPIRPPHALYLTERNYKRQLGELGQAAQHFGDYLFVVKMHPRQSIDLQLQQLIKSHPNLIVRDESTLELAAHADLTLSFWSSAILDSIAVNTPAVEFHYHEVMHSQLVFSQNGKLESLYVNNGFCFSINCLSELLDVLTTLGMDLGIKSSIKVFDEFFGIKIDETCLAEVFDDIYIKYISKNKKAVSAERSRIFKELLRTMAYNLAYKYFVLGFNYFWREFRRHKS